MSRGLVTELVGLSSRPIAEVLEDLAAYEALLKKWQTAQNLVSRETLSEVWERHFTDSLQLLPHLRSSDRLVVDLGSGGGFPALPLAIVLKDREIRFELYEPVGRKASFLRTVARELELNVTVYAARIEARDSRETPDVVTSRALAALDQLFSWILPMAGANTRALLHKGRDHGEEIVRAGTQFEFGMVQHVSRTDPSAVILEVSDLRVKPGT